MVEKAEVAKQPLGVCQRRQNDAEFQAVAPDIRARWPEKVSLDGRIIRLEPVAPCHAGDLYEGANGTGGEALWRYLPSDPLPSFAAFEAYFHSLMSSRDPMWFSVIERSSGRAVGIMSLMRIDVPNRVVEVGGILFTPTLQRSRGSTEAQYLLAKHVFEELGFRRYEWKCDNLNERSKRAALRLGFAFEGVFRQHMIVKGRNRDTAWFSMLDHEWRARKEKLEAWLDPSNFDVDGHQKMALSSLG